MELDDKIKESIKKAGGKIQRFNYKYNRWSDSTSSVWCKIRFDLFRKDDEED